MNPEISSINQIKVQAKKILAAHALKSLQQTTNQKLMHFKIIHQLEGEEQTKIECIFKKIVQYEKLQSIILNQFNIKVIPPSISNMRNLKILQLENNKIQVLPDQLFQLVSLQTLNLQNNNIEQIPDKLSKLQNLQVLILSQNHELQKLTSSVKQLAKLTTLIADRCRLRSFPGGPKSLENLNLAYNILKNPSDIQQLKNLQNKCKINLIKNQFTNEAIDFLKQLRENKQFSFILFDEEANDKK